MTWPRLYTAGKLAKSDLIPCFCFLIQYSFYYIRLTALWSVTAALYSMRDDLCWWKFFLSLYPLQCFWIINADLSSISRLCFSTWPKKMTDTITTYSLLYFVKFWNQDVIIKTIWQPFYFFQYCSFIFPITLFHIGTRISETKSPKAFSGYIASLEKRFI